MKKLLSTLFMLIVAIGVFSQSSNQFKYQAVLRDAGGTIIANQNKTIVFDILKGSASGTNVFTESHNVTTTEQGVINLNIGSINSLTTIDWSSDIYFVQITVEGNIMGTSQLLSVPYSLYSTKAGTADYNSLTNLPITNGSETKINAGTNVTISGTGTTVSPYVINSTNSTPATNHYVGELFGGGIVFYVDNTGQHGLIIGMIDIASNMYWSNIFDTRINTGTRGNWDGQYNTTMIIAQSGHTNSVAKVCADYVNVDYGTGIFSDWYLPSIDELKLLSVNRCIIDKAFDNDNNVLTKQMGTYLMSGSTVTSGYSYYYSSSETYSAFMYVYDNCSTGIRSLAKSDNGGTSSYSIFARPVRAF